MVIGSDYTYEQGKIIRVGIEADVNKWSEILGKFPKDELGLTTKQAKSTKEFAIAKSQYDYYFQKLRQFNSSFISRFGKEIRAERNTKYKKI